MTTDPVSLSKTDLDHFYHLVAHGLLAQAYDELSVSGYSFLLISSLI